VASHSEVVIGRPAARLSPFVDRYVGYRQVGYRPGLHRGLPSRLITFLVSLDRPIETVAGPARPHTSLPGLVSGLHTHAPLIKHDGNEHGIAIELSPLAARAILGVPAGELAATTVGLDDLFGRRGHELIDRLIMAPGWPARFAVLDEVLGAALRADEPVPPEVRRSWHRLTSDPAVSVAALAGEVGWSRRYLTRRFHEEVGLPPRQLRRVVRLERFRAAMHGAGHRTLADAAAAAGYYDQAHLLHEWKDLVGCTLAEWLAEELPSVQDAAGSDHLALDSARTISR
jgi:AraC-like DNA-binding protein